ncbi:MAG: aspartate carbamoyltransferase, partial [Methanobacteriota archaeon]
MKFKGRHLVHIDDLAVEEIEHVLAAAEKMLPAAAGRKKLAVADGKILGTLFYEPSTRTKLSFETAMLRLGGNHIGFADPTTTSWTKGETLADTARIASSYADVLVLRHPHEGSARLAAKFSGVPVVNGGDGAGQHPTQTLLDLFTIRKEKGPLERQRVALVGDLKYGRTVHSLAHALARFHVEMVFVAPPSLQMPTDIVERLKS